MNAALLDDVLSAGIKAVCREFEKRTGFQLQLHEMEWVTLSLQDTLTHVQDTNADLLSPFERIAKHRMDRIRYEDEKAAAGEEKYAVLTVSPRRYGVIYRNGFTSPSKPGQPAGTYGTKRALFFYGFERGCESLTFEEVVVAIKELRGE